MALAEMIDKAQKCVVEPWVVAAQWKDELIKLAKSEEPVSENFKQFEDIEIYARNEADKFASKEYEYYNDIGLLKKGFYWGCKAGANWQEQQMMKDAVDGTFSTGELADGTPIDAIFNFDKVVGNKYEEGEKVKLIVIKK